MSAFVSDRRRLVTFYAAFAAFAGVVVGAAGQPVQRTWGAWAAAGYASAAVIAVLWQSRGREAALVVALAGALAAPLAFQSASPGQMSGPGEGSLRVVARSAVLLLRRGTPYLPPEQITHSLGYNPYEPAMAIFGLPAAAGLHGAAGSPRVWMGVTAAVVLVAAFRLATPEGALRNAAFALSSPVLALPLTNGLTDVPVLALLGLSLAGTAAPRERRGAHLLAALAVGAACAMKATAWPALPVLAAMLAARDGSRTAIRFVVTAGVTAAALAAATAPASVRALGALFQNTVLFPLGMTRYQTRANSPLPGHLLALTGSAGHWAAIGLLCAAGLAPVASLIVRPPADTPAAASRLAICLALMFALAPASRWGYFVYPAGVIGFVTMIRSDRAADSQAVRRKVEMALSAWQRVSFWKAAGERGEVVLERLEDRPLGGTPTWQGKSFEFVPGPLLGRSGQADVRVIAREDTRDG